jgi:hypothetical protein
MKLVERESIREIATNFNSPEAYKKGAQQTQGILEILGFFF